LRSSGDIRVFSIAWQRPDTFRKVFTTIGSFTDIRSRNVLPDLVLQAEKKPIRVFQQDLAKEIASHLNSWLESYKATAAAHNEQGYKNQFTFSEATHNPKHRASIRAGAPRSLWHGFPK
jgi:enterochelin esterase family protein